MTMAQIPIPVTNPSQLRMITDIGLPVIIINTIDKEEPTCDNIAAPSGEDGIGSINANKCYGRMQIIKDEEYVYDSDEYIEDDSGIEIHVRGNTSSQWSKKPFKLNLQRKADLLFRGDNSKYKDKDWVLLAGVGVPDILGAYVNSLVGLQWTPQFMPVSLVLNEDYRGTYLLMEAVKRNVNCRLNVSETGYIFERDPYWWNEDVYFSTDTSHEYTFKYPKDKNVTSDNIEYLRDYMNKVEASFADGTYPELIDVQSFARWLLGQDILANWDCAGSNMFLTKYDDTEDTKVMMANMWDYGMICRMPSNSWAKVHDSYFYFKHLFNSPNKEFVREYKRIWEELYPTLKDNIFEYMRNYCHGQECMHIDASAIWDMRRWGYIDGGPVLQIWDTYEPYLTNHIAWLNENIMALDGGDNGITSVSNSGSTTDAIYDLQGRRLSQIPEKGMFILNGRKVVK